MDEELLDRIRSSALEQQATRELPPKLVDAILSKVATRFVGDPRRTWWWENLSVPSWNIDYGDMDILPEIERAVGRDEVVCLVVTNDEPPPWPIFEGALHEIVSLIGDQSYFEYFLAPTSGDSPQWVIFDTHHNRLVIVGRAGEIVERFSVHQRAK